MRRRQHVGSRNFLDAAESLRETSQTNSRGRCSIVRCVACACIVFLAIAAVLVWLHGIAGEIAHITYHSIAARPRQANAADAPYEFMEPTRAWPRAEVPISDKFSHRGHFCSQKGCDPSKAGLSPYNGTKVLSPPLWTWMETYNKTTDADRNVYNTPLVDSQGNIYITSHTNMLYSLGPGGTLRWSVQVAKKQGPGERAEGWLSTPVILGRYIYVTDGLAFLIKYDLDMGEEEWRVRYSWDVEEGTRRKGGNSALAGANGTVILAGYCSEKFQSWEACQGIIYAIDAKSGRLLWKRFIKEELHANKNPVIYGESVLIMTQGATVYNLDFVTGTQRWTSSVHPQDDDRATGGGCGVVVGLDGFVYAGSERRVAKLDIDTGGRLWAAEVDLVIMVPSVYKVGDRTLVLTLSGHWQMVPDRDNPWAFDAEGFIVALDAATGERVWSFEPPPTGTKGCTSTPWSQAIISADGIVYVARYDGVLYALDGGTGSMYWMYNTSVAMFGNPVLTPDMLLVTTCTGTFAFRVDLPGGRVICDQLCLRRMLATYYLDADRNGKIDLEELDWTRSLLEGLPRKPGDEEHAYRLLCNLSGSDPRIGIPLMKFKQVFTIKPTWEAQLDMVIARGRAGIL